MEKKTRAYWISSGGVPNGFGRFEFSFREPIKDVVSVSIKNVVISNFVGIGNSPFYFLRTDALSTARSTTLINGLPSNVAFLIPNQPYINGTPISYNVNMDSDVLNNPGDIRSVWFEILNSTGTIINPPDIGWSFVVELEYTIKDIV